VLTARHHKIGQGGGVLALAVEDSQQETMNTNPLQLKQRKTTGMPYLLKDI